MIIEGKLKVVFSHMDNPMAYVAVGDDRLSLLFDDLNGEEVMMVVYAKGINYDSLYHSIRDE